MDDKDEQIKALGAVIKKWACPALDDLGSLMLAGRLIEAGYIRPVEPPPVLTEKQMYLAVYGEPFNPILPDPLYKYVEQFMEGAIAQRDADWKAIGGRT